MPQRTEVRPRLSRRGSSRGWRWLHFRPPVPSSPVLDGYGFSASRYGMMFIPQVILAILASSLGPCLGPALDPQACPAGRVERGFAGDDSARAQPPAAGFSGQRPMAILLVATGALGFGFGNVVMALNTYAEEFSPGRENRAVLSLNALLGAGTALAPLLVAIFIGLGAWWLLPLTVAVALAGCFFFSAGRRS